MRRPVSGRWAILAVLVVLLASATALARAGSPPVGGAVPGTLTLSLGEPSPFKRTGATREGNVYSATIRAEVTATDTPVRLSVDGAATTDGRRGDLLKAFALPQTWRTPVANAPARIHLRQVAPNRRALRSDRNDLLLVTLTVGGP